MSEAKHTPGPWHLWVNEKGAFQITIGIDEAVICTRNDWDHMAEQSRANASLIAAAPELLAALKEAEREVAEIKQNIVEVRAANQGHTAHPGIDVVSQKELARLEAMHGRIRAAIAKATQQTTD